MANNKYVFATNIAPSKISAPAGALQTGGWDPEIGTQVPEGANMNYMHRQLSLSNDFWHEVSVDLSGSNTFTISEATATIGTSSSFPAESILFNVTAREGTPRANAIFVQTASAFTDWPIGRSFWVRNNVPDKAIFVSLPDIAANAPSVPVAITGIFKILSPGQYCKFRVAGTGTTRLPYLVLEYDSHWVEKTSFLIGAASDNASSPLTNNTINEYYNGHSFCAMAQIVGTINAPATGTGSGTSIPTANYTVNVVDSYNMSKGSVFPIYQNYNEASNGGGANPYIPDTSIGNGSGGTPNPIFPMLYNGYPTYPGSSPTDIDLPTGAYYGINLGTTDSSDSADLGLIKMRLPDPQGFITTAPQDEANTDIFQKQRGIQSTKSISCLHGVNVGSSVIRPMVSAWQSGGLIIGHSPRDSESHNTVVSRVYASEIGGSTYTPLGQFVDTLYVIYPNPANGDATTPGYF